MQETEDENDTIDATASGLNNLTTPSQPERGRLGYYWVGRYYSLELYRQGMQWLFNHNIIPQTEANQIPADLGSAPDLAMLISLNLVEKSSCHYRLTIPVFQPPQWDALAHLFSPLVEELQNDLGTIVHRVWHEFDTWVPAHLHAQINQYLACYMHRLVGLTLIQMVDNGQLAGQPKDGPMPYGVFFIR